MTTSTESNSFSHNNNQCCEHTLEMPARLTGFILMPAGIYKHVYKLAGTEDATMLNPRAKGQR